MPLQERIPLQESFNYPEALVRFSMAQCDTDDYCVQNLEKKELKALYSRFGTFEQLKWGQVRQMPREKGISIDKTDSKAYALLSRMAPGINTFGHLRVTGIDANTRVFVGLDRDLARVLLIDREGKLQH